jgi:hypothetical protein
LPIKRWTVRPGHIRVYVGPPFATAGLSDDALGELIDDVHDYIDYFAVHAEPRPQGALPARRAVGA